MNEAAPPKIGPYEVRNRLGRGGMGEVLLAWDPRLERRVAIKRIHAGPGLDARQQARFRREARLAAALSHPNIVQVFDLLVIDDVDFIVMEYVQGRSLRRALIDDGAMPLGRGMAIAAGVVAGLAHAHRQGIVHRDLKTENVLLTIDGPAKIADFGIARRLLFDAPDESLTRTGAVTGTWRSMSPEQARGEALDQRTDLFSLGVLLYEVFTGRSPFAADTATATLARVLSETPTPVHELRPEVPPALSQLIDQLLEKEPLKRPSFADEVAATLGAIAGGSDVASGATTLDSTPVEARVVRAPAGSAGSAGATGPAEPGRSWRRRAVAVAVTIAVVVALVAILATRSAEPPPVLYVAVLEPVLRAETPAPGDELLAFAVRGAASRALADLEGLSILTAEEVDATVSADLAAGARDGTTSGPPSAQEVAAALALDELVAATAVCARSDCRVEIQRLGGADGAVVWSRQVEVPRDQLLVVSRAVEVLVRDGYAEYPSREGDRELAVSSAAFEDYLEVQQTFAGGVAGERLDALIDELETIRGAAPRFLDAYLLETRIAVSRFRETRDPALIDRADSLIARARSLAPGDPDVRFTAWSAAIAAGRLDDAGAIVEELATLVPGDVRLHVVRARLLEARGESEAALAEYARAAARRPSVALLYNNADLASRHGRGALARQLLDQLLERSPGHLRARSLLAQVELIDGDPARAAELYEALVARAPGPIEHLHLGLARMLLGEHDAAAAAIERAVAEAPGNPYFLFNLADARLLQGRRDEAAELYRRVLALLAEDPAEAGWQRLTVRAQALAHLGREREAVAAVQEALRLAPEDGQAAFEVALAYALVGDRTAALFNAERAIELGFTATSWFALPWFDVIRDDPSFRQALEAAAGS